MKRSTASWTTAIAASALLAMPVGSWAQQPSPAPSQTPSTSRPAGASARPAPSAQDPATEHLRKAEAALNDIPAASLTGTAKSRVAELKRHIKRRWNRRPASRHRAGKTSASTELAAADRILTELLGGEGTTGAAEPSAAGHERQSSTQSRAGSRRSRQGQAAGSPHASDRVCGVDGGGTQRRRRALTIRRGRERRGRRGIGEPVVGSREPQRRRSRLRQRARPRRRRARAARPARALRHRQRPVSRQRLRQRRPGSGCTAAAGRGAVGRHRRRQEASDRGA